jgi:hypothetical protein
MNLFVSTEHGGHISTFDICLIHRPSPDRASILPGQRLPSTPQCIGKCDSNGFPSEAHPTGTASPRALSEFPKQLLREREGRALRTLVRAVGHDAVAAPVPPGLQGHPQPICDALGRRGIAMALPEQEAKGEQLFHAPRVPTCGPKSILDLPWRSILTFACANSPRPSANPPIAGTARFCSQINRDHLVVENGRDNDAQISSGDLGVEVLVARQQPRPPGSATHPPALRQTASERVRWK